jgi:triacylglycerol lipase
MAQPLKQLLPDTFDNLFHAPDPKIYAYFANAQHHPFVLGSTSLQLVNAWWAADAAVLSYVNDKAKVSDVFKEANFEPPAFFGNWGNLNPQAGPTQCFVAKHGSLAVVSFRGTEQAEYKDLLDDLRLLPSDQGDFLAHQGFCDALDRVWKDVKSCLDQLLNGNQVTEMWFTGHSLGAALATLAACRYNSKAKSTSLYTFGSPRVGSRSMAEKLKGCSTYRFVNGSDIVTLVPPPGGYEHVGQLIYIDSKGRLSDEEERLDSLTAAFRHDIAHLRLPLETLQQALTERGNNLPPPYIVGNHSPARYPVLIWNAI